MSLGRACDRDGELVSKLLADELHKLGRIVKVAVRARPAEGKVSPQREHMVNAVIEIGLELFLDISLGIADAGEMRDRGAFAVFFDLVKHLEVLADVRAARAVGAGDVVGVQRVELFEHAALAAQLFHAHIGLWREDFKRKSSSFLINFRNAHSLPPK